MGIILASASPRRRDLLAMLGLTELTICPPKGEEHLPEGLPPGEAVMALALAKAREVAPQFSSADLVIAADTVVCIDGDILGKPHSPQEAEAMLSRLSGNVHFVYTGLAICHEGRELTEFEETAVRFLTLDDDAIATYVASGEPMDKAGAYGIQGRGALFVQGIFGDYYNVVGLPLCRLGAIFQKLGVKLL